MIRILKDGVALAYPVFTGPNARAEAEKALIHLNQLFGDVCVLEIEE